MLDVVTNHFAWAGNYTTIDYGQFHPFNRQDYFHPFRLLKDDPDNETCVVDVSPSKRKTHDMKGKFIAAERNCLLTLLNCTSVGLEMKL